MQRLSIVLATVVVVGAVMGLLLTPSAAAQVHQVNQATEAQTPAAGQALHLNLSAEGYKIHIMPTVSAVKGVAAQHNGGTPPLLYNGGPVMHSPTVYAIFWVPKHLQDGGATSLSAAYQAVQKNMLKEYFGHALMNNNTQYYDSTYIKNAGTLGGSYVDTSAYPGFDCFDSSSQLTDGYNCITDADLQNEINKVMTLKHWIGGTNHLFLLFTSSDEGQCSGSSCSYVQYCAYHGYFYNGSAYVIYGNEPYGNTSVCQISGAPSPNGNPAADTAATAASHELTESITDPYLDAWYDSSGYEIGDECAYNYGFAGWDGGLANEQWDGYRFFLQTEYSNYLSGWYISDANFTGCFNSGPEL